MASSSDSDVPGQSDAQRLIEPDSDEPQGRSRTARDCAVPAWRDAARTFGLRGLVLSAALLAVAATASWLQRGAQQVADRHGLRSHLESVIGQAQDEEHESVLAKLKCGVGKDDLDIWTKDSLYEMQHIVSAEACNEKCEGEPKCGAWTWGKKRDKEGLTDVCFLKKMDKEEEPTTHHESGVVSGLPCGHHTTTSTSVTTTVEPTTSSEDKDTGDDESTSIDPSATLPPTPSTTWEYNPTPGTLFCWALMMPYGWEPVLLASQFKSKISLFACDGYQVYSNTSLTVTPGLTTNVVNVSLQCDFGGEFKTALNQGIFMAVWAKVIEDGFSEIHDGTVKVDPDCVFFPNRLVNLLHNHTEGPRGTYINNCKFGMHGPIEVFSRIAIRVWAWGKDQCVRHFWRLCSGDCKWGEDMFIDQCLSKVLDVRRDDDWNLLVEDHCDPPDGWESCMDATRVAFHPYKSVEGYNTCVSNAVYAQSAALLT